MDITEQQIIDTLRAVVAERPEYVYKRPAHMPGMDEETGEGTNCYYVHTAPDDEDALTPGCLVGTVLHRLGMPLETLQGFENQGADKVVGALLGLDDQHAVTCALSEAQGAQDYGSTWRDSLALAEQEYAERAK